MRALLSTRPEARDEAWREEFLALAPDVPVVLSQASVTPGPDGLPYGRVHLAPPSAPATTTIRRLAERATDRGYGIVLGATPGAPDWVFGYGDLWSLRAYHSFHGDGLDGVGTAAAAPGSPVIEASPSDAVFPFWARHVVGRWLFDRLGVIEPRAKLFVVPGSRPARNLVFNVEAPLGKSTPEHAALQALAGWFLPPGLGLVTLPPTQPFELEPSVLLLDDFS